MLRLPAVYGIDDYQRRVQSLLDVMDGTDTTALHPMFASFRMSRIEVGNVGDAICCAATHAHPGTFVFAEPTAYTEGEWHQMVAKAAGWQGTITIDDSAEEATDFVHRSSVQRLTMQSAFPWKKHYKPLCWHDNETPYFQILTFMVSNPRPVSRTSR